MQKEKTLELLGICCKIGFMYTKFNLLQNKPKLSLVSKYTDQNIYVHIIYIVHTYLRDGPDI